MDIKELLAELGKDLGLGDLTLDEFGLCQLVFDGELAVDIQAPQEEDHIFLTAGLSRVPHPCGPELLRTLLEANLLGQGTGNAHFAIDPALDEIVLMQRLQPDRLDTARFKHELELFLDVLAAWRQRLHEEGLGAAEPVTEAHEPPNLHGQGMIRA